MTPTPDWQEVGRRIQAAREGLGLSARTTAEMAKWSVTYWQDLERGRRLDGGRFNPSSRKLASAARAVELDPAPLFALVRRTYDPKMDPGPAVELPAKIEDRLDGIEATLAEQGRAIAEQGAAIADQSATMVAILQAIKAADRRLRDQDT